MPDYGIKATSLQIPPVLGFIQPYRPAIGVANTGAHPFLASGLLSIYDSVTGRQLAALPISSGTILPGATDQAQSTIPWTPPAAGTYMAFATIGFTTDGHTYSALLSPVFFEISAEPPPPPPVVEAHAPQHENGGFDELNLTGLPGILQQPQTPQPHGQNHNSGGPDEISLNGLFGVSGSPQIPATHAYTSHDITVETTTAKGIPNGYCPLGTNGKVPPSYLPAQALSLLYYELPSDVELEDLEQLLDQQITIPPDTNAIFVGEFLQVRTSAPAQLLATIESLNSPDRCVLNVDFPLGGMRMPIGIAAILRATPGQFLLQSFLAAPPSHWWVTKLCIYVQALTLSLP